MLPKSPLVGLGQLSQSFTKMRVGYAGGDNFPKPKDYLQAWEVALLFFLLLRAD